MSGLKFINQGNGKDVAGCCENSTCGAGVTSSLQPGSCPTEARGKSPAWITSTVMTEAGTVRRISTEISGRDYWEHVKCRLSAFRNNYTVPPGLYAVGAPDKTAEVFVSANYKLSFDALRKSLNGMNAWVLVLDTKGINVWCAAGKGTFGTAELIKRISMAGLDRVVSHRRIIVPQLGAPGISAFRVSKASGFKVMYGPVRAEDIRSFVTAGYKATREMRTIGFPMIERLILTPMEINPAMKKYFPWYALSMFAIFGLEPGGILFREALAGSLPFILLGLIAVFSGALLTPVLLPFLPSRSFALKGWIAGIITVFASLQGFSLFRNLDTELLVFSWLFFPLASSYIALQFTGATTFTGMSGVKKELKVSIPLYLAGMAISLLLLVVHKLYEWRLI